MFDEAIEEEGPNNSEIYVVNRPLIRGEDRARRQFRLAVALDHMEINALRDSFVGDLKVSLSILGVILLIGAAAQAAIGLRPLRLLGDRLADIHKGRAARLDGRFPAEVAPLASDLNRLLEQQEMQLATARERAGDLAHGLKTPLTILDAESRHLDEIGQQGSAALLREQVSFMRGHVETELARARTRGASVAGGATTAAAEAVGKLVDLLKKVGRGADLQWAVSLPHSLRVTMDLHDFSEVMGNLMDNARKWARTHVLVSAETQGDHFRISVTDDGPGIPARQRSRVVQRESKGAKGSRGAGSDSRSLATSGRLCAGLAHHRCPGGRLCRGVRYCQVIRSRNQPDALRTSRSRTRSQSHLSAARLSTAQV